MTTREEQEVSMYFRQHLKKYFQEAVDTFLANPEGDNWAKLRKAMWAWQHVTNLSDEAVARKAHQFVEILAIAGKGDSDFSED